MKRDGSHATTARRTLLYIVASAVFRGIPRSRFSDVPSCRPFLAVASGLVAIQLHIGIRAQPCFTTH